MKFNHFFLLLSFLFSCEQESTQQTPQLIDGIIDLRSWDFEKDGCINLDGEWEFYWEQLLTPKDFKSKTITPEYIHVQNFGTWLQGTKNKYSGFGYATYRAKILLPQTTELPKINFQLLNLISSAKLWLNNTEIIEFGKVGVSEETSKPELYVFRNLIDKQQYELVNDTLEVVIQSSDYYWGKGGLRECKIGLPEQIHITENTRTIYNSFLLGILFIIGIYHLFLYFFRKQEKSTLFFGLLCFVMFLRTLSVSSFTFRVFNFETSLRLIYFWVPMYPFLLIKFLSKLYPKESNERIIKIIGALSIILCLYSIFIPVQFLKRAEIFIGLLAFLVLLYLLSVVNIKAIKRKRQGAWVSFVGMIVLIIGVVNDYLFIKGFSFGFNFLMIQLTFVIYIILQSINIAERFSISFKINAVLNKNLEKNVEERTLKIRTQNMKLKRQQEEVVMVNENLKKQQLELQEKNTAITDSIQYARTIQKAILPTQNYRKKVFPKSFLIYRPKDIVSGDFFWIKKVDNMELIACVDCTGHGVPGAFMSVIANNLLTKAVDNKHYKPSQILNYLSKNTPLILNQAENTNLDGMDISICRFEKTQDGKMTLLYAGAKSTIYLIQNNKMEVLKGDRKSIGGMRGKLDFSFQDFERKLNQSDMIYMASDGYTDQANKSYKRFGSKMFRCLLRNIYHLPITEQKKVLKKELALYQGNQEQIDDITVIGIRISQIYN